MLDVPLLDPNPRTANLYIQKVKRERGGSAAGLQKNLLANIWKYATTLAEFDLGGRGNPMHEREVVNPYRLRQEHKPWPDPVQDRFLAACDENSTSHFTYCSAPASEFPMSPRCNGVILTAPTSR